MSRKKNKKWIKFRHKIVRNILSCFLKPYSYVKYGIRVERFKEQKKGQPYLILLNHQTAFDQFFVGMAFKGPIYYLATEDLFSNGFISSLIKFLVAPIPIKKQTTDIKAILNCLKVAREGGTIAIAPEGNRTYSGKTEYMNPSIAPLARKLGLPIVLYRIEGGYGVHPRWSDVVRRGKMKGYVHRVIQPCEYATLSDNELFAIIRDGLYVNEATSDGSYTHKRQAEYLERAIFVCPKCGLSTLESHGDIIECKKCGMKAKYLPTKELEAQGSTFPFRFVNDWYEYQKDYINSLDPLADTKLVLYSEVADIYQEIPYKKKRRLEKNIKIELFFNRILIRGISHAFDFSFDSISAVTVLGKNKLNVYSDGKVYQIKGSPRFCALKYVFFFNRYKNAMKGDQNVKFLGL